MNWLLLRNSLLVSGLTTLLAVALGFLAALCLAALPSRWRNLGLAAAVVALALPPFVVTNCWLHYLGANGAWRGWLPLNIFSLAGAVWILVLLLWPITLWAVWGAWQRLEPSQLEADPAVTGGALVRWLLWPMARTAAGLAAVLTFVLALNNFAVPAILQVKVFPAEVWVEFNTTLDPAAAFRASWPLIAAPALMLAWFWRREIAWPRVAGTVAPEVLRRQLGGGWFWACGAATLLLGGLSVAAPVVQLLSAARTWIELPGALAAGQEAIWNSFSYAALAATLVVGLGLAAGTARPKARYAGFARRSLSISSFLLPAAWLPLFVPGVLLGIGLIVVFNREPFLPFYRSAGIVLLALALRCLALGWTGAAHALRATDRDLTDAARLDGATRWQTLRDVQWPQIAPQVAAAWYVVYLLCLWDVESLVLIIPPGGETLALRIFNLLHYGHNAQVNALCLALLGLAVAPLVAWGVGRAVWQATTRRHTPKDGWRREIRSPRSEIRKRSEARNPKPPASGAAGSDFGVRASFGLRTSDFGFRMAGSGVSRFVILGSVLMLGGCSRQSSETEAPIASRFFGRVQIIGTRGVAPGEFNKPRSLAVDRDDNLYVVDLTGRVQKFAPDGRYRMSWQMPQTDLGKPKGMARDAAGNIIVIEPHYQRVNHFTPGGKLVAQWGVSGTNAGQLKMPRAAAVNSRGEIFVSEYGEVERVQRFRLERSEVRGQKSERSAGVLTRSNVPPPGETRITGNANSTQAAAAEDSRAPIARFLGGLGRAGVGPGEFNRAEGLCVDAQDRLYVADSCNHRIQVFDRDGKFLRAFGKPGSGKGELSYPYDVCVDQEGRVFVCEFGNSRLQVFDANGQSLEIIGGPGTEPGRFANPWSLALDSRGDLYVADSQNHRVQKFIRKPAPAEAPAIRNPKPETRKQSAARNPDKATAAATFSALAFPLSPPAVS